MTHTYVCVLIVLGINVFWLQCSRCGTVGKCCTLMLDLSYIAVVAKEIKLILN